MRHIILHNLIMNYIFLRMLWRRNTMQSDATPNINDYRILEIESFTYIYVYTGSLSDTLYID